MTNETKTHVIDGKTFVEVERPAKVGEKVIVVVAHPTLVYQQLGEVVEILETDGDTCDGLLKPYDTGDRGAIYHHQYRVLVPVDQAPTNTDDIIANLVRRVAALERANDSLASQLRDTQNNVERQGVEIENVSHLAKSNEADIRDLDERTQPKAEPEWLTFGEMLDRIKVGDKAVPDDKAYATVTRTPMGLRVVDRMTGEPWDGFVPITYSLFRLKYRIINGGASR